MSKVFRLILEGDQVVPPASTSGSGVATVVFDDEAVTAAYTIRVRGFDFSALGVGASTPEPGDDATGAHVHDGERGVTGPEVFGSTTQDGDDLAVTANADGSITVSGVWDTTDPATVSLADFATALNGTAIGVDAPLYLDLHTVGHPDGAIRGQFVAVAGDGNDTVYGGETSDYLPALDGDDVIIGLDGDDVLEGGSGNDIISGGDGNDTVDGGDGNDTLYGDAGDDSLLGGSGSDYLNGGSESDTLDGGSGTDTLRGGSGDDSLNGGDDDDFVSGDDGNDFVSGGAGTDIVLGGIGMDTLSGGADVVYDRVVSQADAETDTFFLAAAGAQAAAGYDQYEGFEAGIDAIDVRMAGAGSFGDLAFSDYAGVGVKIITPDGSAALLLGQQQADLMEEWFVFA